MNQGNLRKKAFDKTEYPALVYVNTSIEGADDDDQSDTGCSLKEVSVALKAAGTYMAGTFDDYPRLLKKVKK